jgi:hypothetical protein
MSYNGMKSGMVLLETINKAYLELQGDELVDLVNLIVNGSCGVKARNNNGRGIYVGLPSGRVWMYGV